MAVNMKKSNNVVIAEKGLVDSEIWHPKLKKYDIDLLMQIRRGIAAELPGIIEKFNRKQRYFGYRYRDSSDAAYIYVQKRRYVIDLRISPHKADQLVQEGFTVRYRNNFQGRSGWLTGWRVPFDCKDDEKILKWLYLALKQS
jgi:hypothetical protein